MNASPQIRDNTPLSARQPDKVPARASTEQSSGLKAIALNGFSQPPIGQCCNSPKLDRGVYSLGRCMSAGDALLLVCAGGMFASAVNLVVGYLHWRKLPVK
jgi:hypothetical protein